MSTDLDIAITELHIGADVYFYLSQTLINTITGGTQTGATVTVKIAQGTSNYTATLSDAGSGNYNGTVTWSNISFLVLGNATITFTCTSSGGNTKPWTKIVAVKNAS